MKLDLVQTVAFAGLLLFAGYGIKRLIPVLARVNIPAPVVGGLPIAGLFALLFASGGQVPLTFDTTLQVPLQNAFFGSVGFAASLALLKRGGALVIWFLLISTVAAILQNVVGATVAAALGQHPLMGVLAGSVTLTGGPATGLAFAPLFQEAGVQGAATLAVAAAMVGIVAGGIMGGPIGTFLIERQVRAVAPAVAGPGTLANIAEQSLVEPVAGTPAGEDAEAYVLLKHLVVMLIAVAIGVSISSRIDPALRAIGMALPGYIGTMLVAAVIRNVDDATGLFGLSQRVIDDIGNIALALFLAMALMTLRLWEIAGLVVPLVIILLVQVALVAVLCLAVVPRLMGRDYDAAVISGGFCGFMLGTTANAMANMGALVERYGPAPKAYLVVPLVGAFFIDFVNALLISFSLTVWQ